MEHFLIVYDRRAGLREMRRFDDDQHQAAIDARFAYEDATRDEPDVEVVILSGTSVEATRRTHGRYFKPLAELFTIDEHQTSLQGVAAVSGTLSGS